MPWEPTLHANETATQMAALAWATQARRELSKYARDRARNRATAKLGAPRITAALLSGIAHEEVSDAAVRNPRHHVPSRFTPSLYGTSRGGHILGHTRLNAGVFLWIHRARLGQLGTFMQPCWHERLHEESDSATVSQMRAIFAKTCYLCGRNGPGDLAHFATACTSPAMMQRRNTALGNGELTRTILSIAQAIYAVARREPPVTLTASIMAMHQTAPKQSSSCRASSRAHRGQPAKSSLSGRLPENWAQCSISLTMTRSLHHSQTCGHNMRARSCKLLGVSGGSSFPYKLDAPYDGQVFGQLREPEQLHPRTPQQNPLRGRG